MLWVSCDALKLQTNDNVALLFPTMVWALANGSLFIDVKRFLIRINTKVSLKMD